MEAAVVGTAARSAEADVVAAEGLIRRVLAGSGRIETAVDGLVGGAFKVLFAPTARSTSSRATRPAARSGQ